jgi:hypothetical protein
MKRLMCVAAVMAGLTAVAVVQAANTTLDIDEGTINDAVDDLVELVNDDDSPPDLYLDSGMYLTDDGAGTSAVMTQDGSGNLWVVVGSDEDGYTYQFHSSTDLDPEDEVETTQYDGDWVDNQDGTYTYSLSGSSTTKPSGPPPSIRGPQPEPPTSVVVRTTNLPGGGLLIVIFDPATGKGGWIELNPNGNVGGSGTLKPKPE